MLNPPEGLHVSLVQNGQIWEIHIDTSSDEAHDWAIAHKRSLSMLIARQLERMSGIPLADMQTFYT